MPDTFMTARHTQIAALAAHHRLPVITPWRFNAEIGGLISYGIDVADNFRRAAIYACVATTASRADASRTGAAIPSTPRHAAAAWNELRKLSMDGIVAGLNSNAARLTPGAISLSNSSHLPAIVGSSVVETGGVAARARKAGDEATADRIGDDGKKDRDGVRLF